jgi:transposase-like protein
MPADRAEVESGENSPRKGRRLKLIESYGAFSDERLQEVTEKIRGITSRQVDQPTLPHDDAAHPLGDRIGDSIGEPIGDSMGIPIRSPIESPIESSHPSPIESPIESSHPSPIESPYQSPNYSPIESADERRVHDAVLLTESQAVLYFCLERIGGMTTSLSKIARETGISEHTLKSCLKKLREERLLLYGGRQNCGGRMGFTAKTLERRIVLRGDKTKLAKQLQQIDYQALGFVEPLEGPMSAETSHNQINHRMDYLIDHRINHRINHPMDHHTGNIQDQPCSSSIKELLLQGLILDAAFEDLNPRSLMPFLDRFNTTEELQDFLDIANACIAASKDGRVKPIQNPHGFLFAQLRAGYINPPEGYKSRRVQAQELRNRQLEEELATLRRLKEREWQLRFELFQARLSDEDWDRLEREARAKVKPDLGLSASRQIDVYKDTILRQWFEQQTKSRAADEEG